MSRICSALAAIALLAILAIPASPSAAVAQPPAEVTVAYSIVKYGGGLECNMTLLIHSPLERLVMRFPPSFTNITQVEASWKGTALATAVSREEGLVVIDIDLSPVRWGPNATIAVSYYVPLVARSEDGLRYRVRIPYAPSINCNVTLLNVTVRLPKGVDAKGFPSGMVKKTIAGVEYVAYEVYGVFSGRDALERLGRLMTLDLEGAAKAEIQVFRARISRVVRVAPDGSYTVTDEVELRNLCGARLDKGFELAFAAPPGVEGLEARSSVGQPLEVDVEGGLAKVAIPYSLGRGERVTIVLSYRGRGVLAAEGLWPLSLRCRLPAFVDMDYYVDEMEILVYAPDGSLAISESLANLPRLRSKPVEISFSSTPYLLAAEAAIPAYVLLAMGLGAFMYRLPVAISLLRAGSREYLERLAEYAAAAREAVDLDERYLRREVGGREYMRARTSVRARIGRLRRGLDSLEAELRRRGVSLDPRLAEARRELDEAWDDYVGAEEDYSKRRIKRDEYLSIRREAASRIRAIASRVESMRRGG